jgi:hypothetical protein
LTLSHLGRRTAVVVALVPTLLLGLWQGCNVYNSSLLLPGDGGSPGDGRPGDGGPADVASPGPDAEAGPSTCLAKWPVAPLADDPSSETFSWVVAMQSVDVGANPDAGPILDSSAPVSPIGFDLDNDCTCCTAAGIACPTGGSCIGSGVVCDDDAGRDHVALKIFAALPSASAAVNAGMLAGQFSILLQISEYNGTPNDANVTVGLYVSNGLNGVQDGGAVMPNHDGTDQWTVDSHYLQTTGVGQTPTDGTQCTGTSACQPQYVDKGAWVTNGVLVAQPSGTSGTLPLTFGYRANIGGALMKLNNAIVSGTLQAVTLDGGQKAWKIVNGSISGRWPSAQLLGNLATLPNPNVDGSYLCGTDPELAGSYRTVKAFVCSEQDIMSQTNLDNTMATCDALSMSFGFSAEPALLGPVYTVNAPPASGCLSSDGGLWVDKCQ